MTSLMRFNLSAAVALVASLLATTTQAGGPVQAPAACGPQTVTKIVMVPQITYKTTTVPVCVMQPQVKQQNITVCRLVPETKTFSRMCIVMVPKTQTRQVSETVCRMTYEDVPREVVVMVPKVVTRRGMHTVCKPVMVQAMRNEFRDEGSFMDKPFIDCHGCEQVCRVWKPNLVPHQVPVMVCKQQISQVPFEYQETICVPTRKQVIERVCKPVYETVNRQVTETVCVPTQVEKRFQVTVCREVFEPKTVSCTVLVPVIQQRQVRVPVCTMVPKQVTCVVGCGQ